MTVLAKDNGTPSEKGYFDVYIHLSDVNDKPTAVKLDVANIPEGVLEGEKLFKAVKEIELMTQMSIMVAKVISGLYNSSFFKNTLPNANKFYDFTLQHHHLVSKEGLTKKTIKR